MQAKELNVGTSRNMYSSGSWVDHVWNLRICVSACECFSSINRQKVIFSAKVFSWSNHNAFLPGAC
uniref:Uncharacterized protein n=1 Tax=Anguilla anguilla TaxID=7936 RepID=A0A0E9S9D0_ANGAN